MPVSPSSGKCLEYFVAAERMKGAPIPDGGKVGKLLSFCITVDTVCSMMSHGRTVKDPAR